MDFFEHQERAKKNTLKLLLLYTLCLLSIIIVTYPVALIFFLRENYGIYLRNCSASNFNYRVCAPLLRPDVLIEVGIAILALVFFGTIFKLLGLMQGGSQVASSVGGRLVDRNTNDPKERQLLNIVEEMSLASGISVPDTYVLDREMAINAFAAGFSPKDAVVAVTRGTLETLTRDELQGVMGHEFSHILNGDMRLNIRLIALLNGILVVAMLGRVILDITMRGNYSSSYRYRDSDDSRNNNPLGPVIALGFVLYVMGYLGVFFASIIKSAVSRQREFLADASSVQFTRNPLGLASALGKIGGYVYSSKIKSSRAEEVSHMFFADGQSSILHFLFATHPPLPERIKRIDPQFVMQLQQANTENIQQQQTQASTSALYSSFSSGSSAKSASLNTNVVNKIGQLGSSEIAKANQIVSDIPEKIRAMTREIASAQALILALLLNKEGSARGKQQDLAEQRGFAELMFIAEDLLEQVDSSKYIHLVEMSIPTIRILPPSFIERLIADLRYFAEADSELTLFEYTVVVIVQASTRLMRGERPIVGDNSDITRMQEDLEVLLSAVAYSGENEPDKITQALEQASTNLKLQLRLLPEEVCTLPRIDKAITNLATLSPILKRDLVNSIVIAIQFDQKITSQEEQILRAICYLLDCPLPLL